MSVEAARVTGFGADAAVSFVQAARCFAQGEFPIRGLMNSHEFWNPNGLVLVALPLVAVTRDPLLFSVLLAVVQAAAVLACYRWLTARAGERNWIVYLFWLPVFLFTPALSHTAVDLWAQYVGRTALCVLFTLGLSTAWCQSAWRDAALGFLCAFGPAIHLGLLPATPIALGSLLVPSRRRRVRLLALGSGALLALACTFLPWLLGGGASSAGGSRLAQNLASRHEFVAAVLGPVINLPSLLTSPYEGWLQAARSGLVGSGSQVRILTLRTDARLQGFADLRCVLGMTVLLGAALLLLARLRTGAVALEMLAYVLLLLYLWEVKGADLTTRPDFGGMALQALYLGVAAGGYCLLVNLTRSLRTAGHRWQLLLIHVGLLTVAAYGLTSWLLGVTAIARDLRANKAFTLADIPLEDKMEALSALVAVARGRDEVRVAYHNPEFLRIFPYVPIFGARESPPGRNYRADSFFETVLNARSSTRFVFVTADRRAEYVLTYPASSDWARDAGYERVWNGPRLAVWQRD